MNLTNSTEAIPDIVVRGIRAHRTKNARIATRAETSPAQWDLASGTSTAVPASASNPFINGKVNPRMTPFLLIVAIRSAILVAKEDYSVPIAQRDADCGLSTLLAKKSADRIVDAFLRENTLMAQERDEGSFGWSERRYRIRRAIQQYSAE